MPWVAGCSHFTHDQSSIFLRFAACRRSSLATLGDCSSLRALALTRGSAAPSLISLDEGKLRHQVKRQARQRWGLLLRRQDAE